MGVSDEELIALARKAPPVEPETEKEELLRAKKEKQSPAGDVGEFLIDLDLSPGRNNVKIKELYDVYGEWGGDMPYVAFRKSLKSHVKFTAAKDHCRLNYKLLTIQETLKEITSDSQEEN